ncbi:hypothetical protein KAR91_79535 [Candidatus Pacearchaeota archaeon]|nr:hypothetical protein [Candidatus Pacearchaeota archaeon]
MKSRLIIALAFVLLLIGFSSAQAQMDAPYFELLSPTEQQTYRPGDTVEIQWKTHGFSAEQRRGISVRLAERNTWKSTRIGYVTQSEASDIYTFKWIVPENFLSTKGFDESAVNFKIVLRANVNDKLVRKTSTISLLNLQM